MIIGDQRHSRKNLPDIGKIMEINAIFPQIAEEQNRQLSGYMKLLAQWNQRINLVSRREVERLWENHILPSTIPLTLVDIEPRSRVLDIGSGGGLPGIPLKIIRPDLQIVMVDSIRKKVLFLKAAIAELGLENIAAVNQRVEVLSQRSEFQGVFDVVTARAVSSISQLARWGIPFLKKSGFLLLWKGRSDLDELKSAAARLKFSYQILYIPDHLQHLTPKFREFCIFVIEHFEV